MTDLQHAQQVISTLSRPEKAKLIQQLAREVGDDFPGIERTEGILGGSARLVRTRIPVWVLVRARQLGTSEAEMLTQYPSLRADDLTHAWAYERSHKEEIVNDIQTNEAD